MKVFCIMKSVLATYTKFDDAMRNKCGVLISVKRIYVHFNYAMNIYVNLHLIRALNSSITTLISINILSLH